LRLEIAPQKGTQDSVRDNETLPIALESKACAPAAFVGRESRVEASGRFRGNVQADAPGMHLAGCQLKGAGTHIKNQEQNSAAHKRRYTPIKLKNSRQDAKAAKKFDTRE
jgi:hypothetical protein